jgi:DNA-binding XRE family transcriptional regulator
MAITLAKLIREARLRHGSLTQAELGRLVHTSLENITAIENSRNKQPKPEIIAGLGRTLDLRIEDIYAAIAGTLNRFPWEKVGDLDLKDPELELMFHQVDSVLAGEAKERVKAFIRFSLDEERKRLAVEKGPLQRTKRSGPRVSA